MSTSCSSATSTGRENDPETVGAETVGVGNGSGVAVVTGSVRAPKGDNILQAGAMIKSSNTGQMVRNIFGFVLIFISTSKKASFLDPFIKKRNVGNYQLLSIRLSD
jgi:hypothetical protein